METEQIISWLRDRAKEADPTWRRVMLAAAERLEDSKGVEIDQFNKWIPVTERLPKRFVYVLVMTDFGDAAVARLKGNGRWYIGWDNDQYAGITHWMPLPQPPKGE